MSTESLDHRVTQRIAARELLSLAESESPEFWEAIIDEARKHLPPEPEKPSSREAMNDQEARIWGGLQSFPRGKYEGQRVDDVPLDYVAWWLDHQDPFTTQLRRYYNSPRVQAELRAAEPD